MSFLSSSIQGNSKVGDFQALIKELSNRLKRFPLVTEDLNRLESSLKNFEKDGINYLRLPNRSLIAGLWVSWMAFKRPFLKIQKSDFLELIQKYLFDQIKSIEEIYTQTVDHISSSTTDINEAIKEVPKSIKKLQKTAQKLPELAINEEKVLQHDIIYQAYKMFDNFNSETLSKYKALFEISNIDEFGTKSTYSMVLFHIKNCLDALTDSLSIDPKVHKSQFENYWTEEFHHNIWENQIKRSEQVITKLFGKPPKISDSSKAQSDYPRKKKKDSNDLDTATMYDSQADATLHNRALLNDAKLDRIIRQLQELKQDVANIQDDITDQKLKQDQFQKRQLTTEELEEENDRLCLDNNLLQTSNKNLTEENRRLQSILNIAIQKLKGEGQDFEAGDLIEQIREEKNKLMVKNEELQKRLLREQQISEKALVFTKAALSPGSKASFKLNDDSSSSSSSDSNDEESRLSLNSSQLEQADVQKIWILYQKALNENKIRRDQEEKNSKLLQKMEITKQKKHQYKSDAKQAQDEIVKLQIQLKQTKEGLVTLRNTKDDENNREIIDRLDEISSSIIRIGSKPTQTIDPKEISKLKAENQSLKAKIEGNETLIKELKSQISKLESKNSQLQTQLLSSQNDSVLQELIEQEKKEKKQYLEKVNSLTKENAELKVTINNLETQIKTIQTTVQTSQTTNENLTKENTELNTKIKELTKTVETYTTTVKTLQKANDDLKQNSQASGQELQKKNSELIEENNKLKGQISELTKNNASMKDDKKKLEGQYNELKSKFEDLKNQFLLNYNRALQIEKQNESLKIENKTVKELRAKLDELTTKRTKLNQLSHDYGELQDIYNSTTNKLIKWKGKEIKREEAPALWQQIKKEYDKCNSEFGETSYKIVYHDNIRLIVANNCFKEIAQTQIDQTKLTSERIKKLTEELEHLKAEKIVQSKGDLTKKYDELTTQITNLQSQNKMYAEGLDILETFVNHKKNSKQPIQDRIESIKTSINKKLAEAKYTYDLEEIPEDGKQYEEHMKALTKIQMDSSSSSDDENDDTNDTQNTDNDDDETDSSENDSDSDDSDDDDSDSSN